MAHRFCSRHAHAHPIMHHPSILCLCILGLGATRSHDLIRAGAADDTRCNASAPKGRSRHLCPLIQRWLGTHARREEIVCPNELGSSSSRMEHTRKVTGFLALWQASLALAPDYMRNSLSRNRGAVRRTECVQMRSDAFSSCNAPHPPPHMHRPCVHLRRRKISSRARS
jgi:hypothetical protein